MVGSLWLGVAYKWGQLNLAKKGAVILGVLMFWYHELQDELYTFFDTLISFDIDES